LQISTSAQTAARIGVEQEAGASIFQGRTGATASEDTEWETKLLDRTLAKVTHNVGGYREIR